MAANITASLAGSGGGPEFLRSPRGIEIVKLQGASTAVNDTSQAYQCQYIQKPAFVIGAAFASTISGSSVTFQTLVAQGNNAIYVIVCEAI